MQGTYHETGRFSACLILLLTGIVTLGCDRPLPRKPEVPTDHQILRVVFDVDDMAPNPRELRRIPPLFAPGCEPSKEMLLRYGAYHYEGKLPVVSGDSATVTVIVKDGNTGDPAGELKWSMTKINGVWRLKDAPLPALK
jgi:hypothetical protein